MFRFVLLIVLNMASFAQAQSVDPTKPFNHRNVTEKQQPVNTLVLESIISSGDHVKAVINKASLVKGDYIGEYQLIEISKTGVVLLKDDEQLTLRLYPKVIVK